MPTKPPNIAEPILNVAREQHEKGPPSPADKARAISTSRTCSPRKLPSSAGRSRAGAGRIHRIPDLRLRAMAEKSESTDELERAVALERTVLGERAAGLGTARDRLAEQLRQWNADEDGEKPVPTRTTAQILEESDRLSRAQEQREVEDRIAAEVEMRLAQIEENTRPKAPPIYRRDLKPAEKSRLMARLGDGYLKLPWAPPRP
jgi:hypothetical protein